eukprot:scaffold17515_cov30-Tisochrysis_lutea.AAC.2
MRSVAPSTVSHSSRTRTWQSGLMSPTRSASATPFETPTVCASACSCRFVLEMHTSSRSTRDSEPTPERASASTVQLPTPPNPTTTT